MSWCNWIALDCLTGRPLLLMKCLTELFYVVAVVAVVSVDRVALLSKKFNGREFASRRISVVPRVPVGCNRNRPDE